MKKVFLDDMLLTKEMPTSAGSEMLSGYMSPFDSTVFEKTPLTRLAAEGQLKSYKHEGFWQCMDNKREMELLEKLFNAGSAPWKKWED